MLPARLGVLFVLVGFGLVPAFCFLGGLLHHASARPFGPGRRMVRAMFVRSVLVAPRTYHEFLPCSCAQLLLSRGMRTAMFFLV
eukprot:11161102-Lingulodinium_polyedra.AAC.1